MGILKNQIDTLIDIITKKKRLNKLQRLRHTMGEYLGLYLFFCLLTDI